jgi:hypothetical protein
MNCELMLTYDPTAYMFNVYKNQLSINNVTFYCPLPTFLEKFAAGLQKVFLNKNSKFAGSL